MGLDIIIKNEDDAWEWLKRALNNDPVLDEPVNLKFDGWPTLDLHFSGHDFDSSVPTRIMPPLLDAQKEIHRLFCQLRFGESNLRKLSSDDRERLELVVKVDKGSSDFKTKLDEKLNEIIQATIQRMDSKHIMITLITCALIWGSNVAWKNWLDEQAKASDVESRVQMSTLEKDKLKIMSMAYKREPMVKDISNGVNEFRNHSLHKLKPADSFTIPNTSIEVDGGHAADITHKPREQSVEMRIDGEFIIQSVTSGDTHGFRIKAKRVLDGKVVNISIPDGALNQEQKEVLKNNEWAKRPVLMEINAKVLRGQITSATLVSAKDINKNTKS